jgi:hypothetical protein
MEKKSRILSSSYDRLLDFGKRLNKLSLIEFLINASMRKCELTEKLAHSPCCAMPTAGLCPGAQSALQRRCRFSLADSSGHALAYAFGTLCAYAIADTRNS